MPISPNAIWRICKLNRLFGPARCRYAAVARRSALVRDLSRAHRHGGATGIFDGRPAIYRCRSSSRQCTYITGFRGVIEDGKLARVWCVARDVTRAHRSQRSSASETGAIATVCAAVGRRGGARPAGDRRGSARWHRPAIGRPCDDASTAAASRATPEVRLLLGEATHTVREVQSITQRVIADLSPPGLYDLGLEPALKWLSVYMRSKDNLEVDLKVAPDAAAYDLDLRVLVFKLIRELLRNVVKHSGVRSASVTVSQTPSELRVVVEDHGVGFEWQLSLFEARSRGLRPVERGGPGARRRRRDDGRYRAGPRMPRVGGVSPQRNGTAAATRRTDARRNDLEGAAAPARRPIEPAQSGFFARRRDMRSAASRPW